MEADSTTTRRKPTTEARIENPAMSVPGAFEALQRFGASASNAGTRGTG
jgi:hypothetical protein